MTVADEISEHGIAKGNLENLSTIVRRNRFLVMVGKGPLISRFSLSKGAVALIKCPSYLKKRGFISLQHEHEFTTFLTSKEKDKFLELIQRYIRV